MNNHVYHVYIIMNKPRGTLYIGVTNDLVRRIYEHKHGITHGFSSRYKLVQLVYAEQYNYIEDAIAREKQLKNWKRSWKIERIEFENPKWKDLYETYL